MRKLLYAIIILIVLAGILRFVLLSKGNETNYRTEKITRGTIRATITATGTVNPLTTVLVGTQVSGRIKELYADYNAPVKQGQLIAEIDPATFEAQLEQARANLLSAEAALTQAEASLLEAKRNLARKKELFANNIIGQSEFDAVETNYEVAKSQVNVAKAQVVQTQAAFSFAETNLRYTKIYSPVDGIVISRDVDIGQTVAASFQTPTLFTIAEDMKKMQINTNVDEADIGKIEVGQETLFTVDAYPDITFRGKVIQIRNAPIVVQNVVTYDVVVSVGNPELKLKPGMTANVSIIVATQEDVLRLPNVALRFTPEDPQYEHPDSKAPCIWLLINQEPTCREIGLGIYDNLYTELASGDVTEGQEVIVGYLEKEERGR